ncbi:hypothetical protein, partial [Burkholderia sp. LMG 13014]|uniref:hypothetical protein n=1 Tax=Burkholderia sp. LMG 13014 TaxID=2709306 RepID=UPI001963C90A
ETSGQTSGQTGGQISGKTGSKVASETNSKAGTETTGETQANLIPIERSDSFAHFVFLSFDLERRPIRIARGA